MRAHEYEANQTNKRGIVVDRDPARQKIRVQFEDEDGVVSHWIDVLASAGSSTKTFMMPDMGDEVWCALDAKGEDGCLMGVKYNTNNAPPYGSNDDIGLVWPGGSFHLNKGSGAVTLTTDGDAVVTAGGSITLTAPKIQMTADEIELTTPVLTNNGTDISDQHKHKDVTPGPAETGPPA